MKKASLFVIFLLGFIVQFSAQTSYSCYYREYCDWNEYAEKFEDCQGYEEASLFTVSENETMFSHTIETMKSTYFITEKEYDWEKNITTFYTTSDVGNKYIYIYDPDNKEIRVLISDEDGTRLLRFYVKAIF
jgi:hypothetical protein